MNCSEDEYGLVDVDNLIVVHHKRVNECVKFDGAKNDGVSDETEDFEPTIYGGKMVKLVSPKECVGPNMCIGGKPDNSNQVLHSEKCGKDEDRLTHHGSQSLPYMDASC